MLIATILIHLQCTQIKENIEVEELNSYLYVSLVYKREITKL